jgi:hypothetical protein
LPGSVRILPEFDGMHNLADGVAKLLTMIRGYSSCQFNLLCGKYMAIVPAIKSMFYFSRRESNQTQT